MPEDETFTTQAANYLGMSRQHFVDLLEQNEIPYHKVRTHRRVTFKDLLALSLDKVGLYDSDYTGEK